MNTKRDWVVALCVILGWCGGGGCTSEVAPEPDKNPVTSGVEFRLSNDSESDLFVTISGFVGQNLTYDVAPEGGAPMVLYNEPADCNDSCGAVHAGDHCPVEGPHNQSYRVSGSGTVEWIWSGLTENLDGARNDCVPLLPVPPGRYRVSISVLRDAYCQDYTCTTEEADSCVGHDVPCRLCDPTLTGFCDQPTPPTSGTRTVVTAEFDMPANEIVVLHAID